jgi:integrase/recombinase XerD
VSGCKRSKLYKEREIPIPARLVVSLKAWKAKANGCLLVFPTVGCNPKLDFLACLKAAAERAELDKGGFWLHKFRATFATWHLCVGRRSEDCARVARSQ